jgi:radical SAM protein with 4Fe4S-binding SPASM domain
MPTKPSTALATQEIDPYILPNPPIDAPHPTRIWFALTGRCNLSCIHCPRIAGVSSDEDMQPELYQRLIGEVFGKTQEVVFGGNNLGEQMVHPAFFPMLTDIRGTGANVVLTTNGTKLDEESAQRLARLGIRLRISLEGMGEVYQQIRGAKWDKLLIGLRAYRDEASRHPEAGSTLEFCMTAFAANVHQLPDLVHTAKELRADRILVQHLLPKNSEQKVQSLFFHRTTANEVFDKTETVAKETGVRVELPARPDTGAKSLLRHQEPAPTVVDKKLAPCYFPWMAANVLENGDVLPCCVADGSLIMGNLKQRSFDEIWNGRAYQRLRTTVNSDRPLPSCATCTMRGHGATEHDFTRLSDSATIAGRLKGSLKSYLLKTKRKKTLAALTKVKDSVHRLRARV